MGSCIHRTFGGLTTTINKPVLFLEPTAGLYSDTVPLKNSPVEKISS